MARKYIDTLSPIGKVFWITGSIVIALLATIGTVTVVGFLTGQL